jgi:hypothetical protein
MSYDLYFKPRSGEVDPERLAAYFRGRRHYTVDSKQAVYENNDTGVHFIFELENESEPDEDQSYPVAFNLAFYRPTFFGLEAEPEVADFVREFDMTISDPQFDGMGDGEYSSQGFLTGWNHGNEFAYASFLNNPDFRNDIVSYPTAELLRVWTWNRKREGLQQEVGPNKFVPIIMFWVVSGKPVTGAIWPKGAPLVTDFVDFLLVERQDLAPTPFTFLSWGDALPLLTKYGSPLAAGGIMLNYAAHADPDEVTNLIASLPETMGYSGVPPYLALNKELVDKYTV